MNPELPHPVYTAFNGTTKLFTKDQLLAYRAEVIEMCANLSPNDLGVCASYSPAHVWQIYSDALRNLK